MLNCLKTIEKETEETEYEISDTERKLEELKKNLYFLRAQRTECSNEIINFINNL